MGDNKRIAKNSILLYIRLIITTIIGLYTARVVLLQLGADDFGLFAVVGGVVLMMNFLGTTMTSTSNRFIAVEFGLGEKGNVNQIFNTSLVLHIILALFLVIFAEIAGSWYIKNYLNVSLDKISDALYILHLIVASTFMSVVSIPYRGLVTANENFKVRVSIEILRSIFTLILVLQLVNYTGNKLRAYAFMMLLVSILPFILYIGYCWIKQREVVHWKLNKKWSSYKKMVIFSGWIMIGALAHIGVRQGAAIVVNLFFGTILNAAFGIASQIYNYVMTFVANINQAAVPQIMKSLSAGNSDRSISLTYYISKYSFFIFLIPTIPLLLSVESILTYWLVEVPVYAREFTILMIINGLISSTGNGFDAIIQATGKIKHTQIWYSIFYLSTIPVAYMLFKHDFSPYIITVVTICATISFRVVQILILTKITDFKIASYLKITLSPIVLVTLTIIPQFFVRKFFGTSLLDLVLISITSIILVVSTVYLLGLKKLEKDLLNSQIKFLKAWILK